MLDNKKFPNPDTDPDSGTLDPNPNPDRLQNLIEWFLGAPICKLS